MNNHKSISFDEVLQTPELSHLHEVIHFLNEKEGDCLFPRKRDEAIKFVVNQKVSAILRENPSIALKQVMSLVLDTLPNDLSSTTLLSMTKFVIYKHEKHGATSRNLA
jgi:hypothetical protein